MTIELNEYGFCMDSNWFYIALDWKLIVTTALLVTAYKIYKIKRGK